MSCPEAGLVVVFEKKCRHRSSPESGSIHARRRNTPLVNLERMASRDAADIFVKDEVGNPTGSMKDWMASSMIGGAERRGELKSGRTVVEYTAGSTGASLAMICAKRGCKAISFAQTQCIPIRKFLEVESTIASAWQKISTTGTWRVINAQ